MAAPGPVAGGVGHGQPHPTRDMAAMNFDGHNKDLYLYYRQELRRIARANNFLHPSDIIQHDREMVAAGVNYPLSNSGSMYLEIWEEWAVVGDNRAWWATRAAHEQRACRRALKLIFHDCIRTMREKFKGHAWPVQSANGFQGANLNIGPRIYGHPDGLAADDNHTERLPYLIAPQGALRIQRQGYWIARAITGDVQGLVIETDLAHHSNDPETNLGHGGPATGFTQATARVGNGIPAVMRVDPHTNV